MKRNASLYIALLCGSLLLSLNWASAQKKPRSAPAQTPSSTPTPTLEGSYTLIDSAAATKTIEDAIEAIVSDMWWPKQGKVRGKLRKKNLPPPLQITISYTQTDATIASEWGTVQTSLDGKFFDRTIQGDKVEVSTQWKGGKLARTFKSKDGERVNTYSLSGDGKTLTIQVTVTSNKLPRPLTYELVYTRVAAHKFDT